MVIAYIVILLYFLLANLNTTIIFKKSFNKCIVLTMMLCSFSLYFSQLIFKTFNVGFIINILYCLLPIIYLIKERKNKQLLKSIKDNYLTNGFYFFIVLVTIICAFHFKRSFVVWDELSHWGIMIKEMLRLDSFYSVTDSVLQVHKDYPPLLQLFELFIVKLCGYKECFVIVALHVLMGSFLIYFIPEKKSSVFNIISGSVLSIILMFFVTLSFDGHGIINAIYNDYFMAFVLAYIVCLIYLEDDKKSFFILLNISIASSFLLLTKQMGLPLFLIVLFLYVVLLFDKKKKSKKELILIFIMLIVVPAIMYFSWKPVIRNINVIPEFDVSTIKITKIPSMLLGSGVRSEVGKRFLKSLLNYNISNTIFNIPYIQSIVLSLLLLYLLLSKNSKLFKSNKYSIIVALLLGSMGYAFVMLNIYLFSFTDYHALILTSFERYMATYTLVILYVDLIIAMNICFNKKDYSLLIYSIIVLFLIMTPGRLRYAIPKVISSKPNVHELDAKVIDKYVEDSSKVFLVSEGSDGREIFEVKYYANPIMVNLSSYNWPLDTDPKEYYSSIVNEISEYDYLYIINVSDEYKEKYSFVFNNEINDGQLYKINKDENNISYELINKGE